MKLAERLHKKGAAVTLFLHPVCVDYSKKGIRVIKFHYFDELRDALRAELKEHRYDTIIHSAAVSDFIPLKKYKGKLESDKKLTITLVPLPKIIRDIRKSAPYAQLIMFKLETGMTDAALVAKAQHARKKAGADIVIANMMDPYKAFIIDAKGSAASVKTKDELIKKLADMV